MMRFVLAFVLLTIFVPAAPDLIAQTAKPEPREIDFSVVLIGHNGKPMVTGEQPGTPLTLGDVVCAALAAPLDTDRNSGWKEKKVLSDLIAKIEVAGKMQKHVVLDVGQLDTIRERVGKAWGVEVVGAAIPLIDPASK